MLVAPLDGRHRYGSFSKCLILSRRAICAPPRKSYRQMTFLFDYFDNVPQRDRFVISVILCCYSLGYGISLSKGIVAEICFSHERLHRKDDCDGIAIDYADEMQKISDMRDRIFSYAFRDIDGSFIASYLSLRPRFTHVCTTIGFHRNEQIVS